MTSHRRSSGLIYLASPEPLHGVPDGLVDPSVNLDAGYTRCIIGVRADAPRNYSVDPL
ncbi:MAG: hypothetical protein NTY03_07375 [Candidatus Bathyarchaeota archaeon]|nr:hypothetical protein [Candidatus Bathyarchaeota archaeon]